jgi:hypothetical protein
MTQAQKNAKAKFKQAIAYRTKTGVSLKEAFAHIYGKKKVVKKAVKKAAPKKKAVKKVAKKRIAGPKDSAMVKKELAKKGLKMPHGYATIKRKRKISGVKKKKITETGILNRIHKVKKDVERLDEAQHKHMIGMNNNIYHKMAIINTEIISKESGKRKWVKLKKGLVEKYGLPHYKKILDNQTKMITELKKHKAELKKLI